MATLAAARTYPDEAGGSHWRPSVSAVMSSAPEPIVRTSYQPSRRSGPIAGLASVGVILAAMAALATLDVVADKKVSPHLTVVSARQLDVTPPPPAPRQQSDKPLAQALPVSIPKPMIALPAPGPTQVALDAPPLPSALLIAGAPKIAASAGPTIAVPAPSSEPAEGGDLSSQVLSARPPTYPIDARRRREEGTVKLLVLVGPDGRVSDIQLAGSSGSQALDRAALGAVRRWRWAPQTRSGAPVAVRGYVTIPFVLTK